MNKITKHTQQEPSLKTKLVLFSGPFFVLLLAFIIHRLNSDLYGSIFGFDPQGAYGEWIQFICYSVAGVIGVATWRLLRKNGLNKEGVLIALFSIGCFFIALEEISYGQWIFKWETPALFQEINTQGETNLHNITGLMNIHLLFMVIGFFGGFAWVYKRISKGGLFTDLVCPEWHYASYFFPVFVFYFYWDFIRPHFHIIGNQQELFELILSFGFLLLSFLNYRKVATLSIIKSAPKSHIIMISTKLNIILKNVLLVFCSLLIALIIAEVIARLFVDDSTNRGAINNIYKFYEFDSKLGWKNKSNYKGTFEREEFKYNVSINSEGMRYKEIQKDRLNNKKRIAVMGDSFTWGVGVKDSDRFTDIVENKSNEKYEVLNFGVSGYGPLRYLIQLDKVLEFNPDIVLLTFCLGNDFVDNVFFNRYGYYGPFTILNNKPEIEIYGYPIPKMGEFHDSLETSYPFLNSFLEKSKLYYLTNLFIRKLNTEKIGSNFKYTNQPGHSQSGHLGADENQKDIYVPNHSNDAKLFGLDLAVVNKKILSKISDRLAEQNIKFSIVVAPTKCEYNQCFPSSLKEQDNKGNNNNARNLLLNDLKDLGIHYIDSTDSINLNDFWEIDSHWKPSAHVKISNDILKWLSNK